MILRSLVELSKRPLTAGGALIALVALAFLPVVLFSLPGVTESSPFGFDVP